MTKILGMSNYRPYNNINKRVIWPGFGDNMRILKWIVLKIRGEANAVESPIGWMPTYEDIDWAGLDFTHEQFDSIMDIDREEWKAELLQHVELFEKMYDKLPKEFIFMRELLLSGLWRSPVKWRLEPERF